MRKLILMLMLITMAFSMEPWEQKATLNKILFQKELSLISQKTFNVHRFDFFKPIASRFSLEDKFDELVQSNTIGNFIKVKARFLVDFESMAYHAKSFDYVDLMDFDENVSKEKLFGAKARKAFITLGKENLSLSRRPLMELYLIKYNLKVIDKDIPTNLFIHLNDAIVHKNQKKFYNNLKKLEQIILTIKEDKLSDKEVKKMVRSFVRYCKLTALDYGNALFDDGSIRSNLEYTEAVVFSAKAKENLIKLSANIQEEDFKTLLNYFETIITDIQQKKNIKEVQKLTKEARKTMLKALNLNDIQSTPKEIVKNIINNLNMLEAMVDKEDFKQAEFIRLEAYSFFDPDIETRLKPRNPQMSAKLEGLFWNGSRKETGLAVLIKNKNTKETSKTIKTLKSELEKTILILNAKLTFTNAMTQSAMIVIREGLEIVLVLALLLSLLKQKREKNILYLGAFLGFLASVATYYAAKYLIEISTSSRELIEGTSALLASLMLIFITAWIFHNTYVKGWIKYSKELAQKSISSKNRLTMLFVGFLIFYREGFESVLFFESLGNEAGAQPVWLGFVIGSTLIIILGIAIIKYVRKVSLQYFFSITGLFLSILAVIFAGAGIRGMQTANLLSVTPAYYLPNNIFLSQWFGYYPTVETFFTQLSIMVLLFGFYLFSKFIYKQK